MTMKSTKPGLISTLRTASLAVATVVLATAAVVTVFGDQVKTLMGMSADSLAGDGLVERRTTKSKYGGLERKTLASFGQQNSGYGDGFSAPSTITLAPNPVTSTARDALSTFGIDVDTASYTWSRRAVLEHAQVPTAADVRVEEWVNAFDYGLAAPSVEPVAISVEGAVSPFDEAKTLVKVSLKARAVEVRQVAHLVFLVDVSGSMSGPDRLPLAQRALTELVANLNGDDTVSLVTYAGQTEVVLPPTSAAKKAFIRSAIERLGAGGGTNMGSGMELAYKLAVGQVAKGTTTRVIVLTDGDTNIGPNLSTEQMLSSIHSYVEEGVTMTTVGFGMGNYRGQALEQLADKGNGQALYLASEGDIRKVFGTQLTSTLEVVGKDVKVQVAFDPKVVSSYRLLGYENRAVADEDFRNDKVDAGEMGSGHMVTALYEVALTSARGSLGSVSVRGTSPESGKVWEVSQPVERKAVEHALSEQGADFRFATAVALGADTARGNAIGSWSLSAIARLAEEAAEGREERVEFVRVLRRLEQLRSMPTATSQY